MGVQHLKSEGEWEAALAATKGFNGAPLIVDFSAEWCGPCKMIGPVFEKLAAEFPGVKFATVDVDELQEVAAECGVRAMPTFQAYANGQKVDELTGADPGRLRAMVAKLAATVGPSGPGQKLGGGDGAPAPPTGGDDLRARMAAAAEARMKAAAAAAQK